MKAPKDEGARSASHPPPSIVSYRHRFVLRPGAVQFLTQVVEISPVLNRVFRLCFPGVQQRDQSLDFLELTRHSFTMFLVVIPLGEIMFSGLAHKSIISFTAWSVLPCLHAFHCAFRDAISNAKFRSRSPDTVIRVYDEAGNVIEAHEHAAQFQEP